jgi:hypothetical protein
VKDIPLATQATESGDASSQIYIGTYTTKYTPAANYAWSGGTTGTKTVVCSISNGAPTYIPPAASSIVYGQPLSASTLSGGSVLTGGTTEVLGSWAWKYPSTVPTVVNGGYLVTFTPTDTETYEAFDIVISVPVAKGTYNPSDVTHPALSAAWTATNTLADVPGLLPNFRWVNPDEKLYVSKSAYAAIYNADPSNMNDLYLNITVNVTNTNAITKPTAAAGLSYNGTERTGVADIPDPSKASLTSGTVTGTNAGDYSATFTLVAGEVWADGTSSPITVAWSISRRAVTISWSGSTAVQYTGSPLSAPIPSVNNLVTVGGVPDVVSLSVLGNATETGMGTYYRIVSAVVGNANYTTDGGTNLTISWSITEPEKEIPIIDPAINPQTSYPTATEIAYGQALSASTLLGGVARDAQGNVILGTFQWENPTTKIYVCDAIINYVKFIPADQNTYAVVSGIPVWVIVKKATPLIVLAPTAGDILLGSPLVNSILKGGKMKNPYDNLELSGGTFTWKFPQTVPTSAGTFTFDVIYTPSAENFDNYTVVPFGVDEYGVPLTFKVTVNVIDPEAAFVIYFMPGNFGTGSAHWTASTNGVFTVPSNLYFTREGYDFVAWNTAADGESGVRYDVGDAHTLEAGLTLYPMWKVKSGNGGGTDPTPTPPSPDPDEKTIGELIVEVVSKLNWLWLLLLLVPVGLTILAIYLRKKYRSETAEENALPKLEE